MKTLHAFLILIPVLIFACHADDRIEKQSTSQAVADVALPEIHYYVIADT